MSDIGAQCVAAYREHKNLKLAAADVGIPWQTLYVHLRRVGEPVTGDKARYGSETDKLAARSERWFAAMVPEARDNNEDAFQAKVDFAVGCVTADIKVSRPRVSKTGVIGWVWSVKKQEMVADYFVCLGLVEADSKLRVEVVLLIPGELVRHYQTIRVSTTATERRGKWWEYSVKGAELRDFFLQLNGQEPANHNEGQPAVGDLERPGEAA